MNKRGINSIEMVMSFLIFIGFVIFSFYFFNPIKEEGIKESSLEYAFMEIVKNTSTESEIYSIKLDPSDYPNKKVKIELSNSLDGNAIVSDYYDSPNSLENIHAIKTGDFVEIDFGSFTPNINLFILKISKDIKKYSGTLTGNFVLNEELYEIASVDVRRLISKKRFIELKNHYSDYDKLKDYFNLPKEIDFSFSLKINTEEILVEKKIPLGVEVYNKKERVDILEENGNIIYGELNVKIW